MATIVNKFNKALDPTCIETGILAATLGFFAYGALALLIGA